MESVNRALDAAAVSPQLDMQARSEAESLALGDFGQPPPALGKHGRINAFRH